MNQLWCYGITYAYVVAHNTPMIKMHHRSHTDVGACTLTFINCIGFISHRLKKCHKTQYILPTTQIHQSLETLNNKWLYLIPKSNNPPHHNNFRMTKNSHDVVKVCPLVSSKSLTLHYKSRPIYP
jgi:hypothetical protein